MRLISFDFNGLFLRLTDVVLDGYGFPHNQTLTVVDQVNGNKVGWALGAILYEINALPWAKESNFGDSIPWGWIMAGCIVGMLIIPPPSPFFVCFEK